MHYDKFGKNLKIVAHGHKAILCFLCVVCEDYMMTEFSRSPKGFCKNCPVQSQKKKNAGRFD